MEWTEHNISPASMPYSVTINVNGVDLLFEFDWNEHGDFATATISFEGNVICASKLAYWSNLLTGSKLPDLEGAAVFVGDPVDLVEDGFLHERTEKKLLENGTQKLLIVLDY